MSLAYKISLRSKLAMTMLDLFIQSHGESKVKRYRNRSGILVSLLSFFLTCWLSQSLAQQLPIFSLYHENSFVLNPAMTGAEDHGIISASYRDQWSGMDGRPRTVNGTYRSPIPRTNMGLGGHVINDITGPTSFTGATVTYAYHFRFKKVKPFSWGAFLRNSKYHWGFHFQHINTG